MKTLLLTALLMTVSLSAFAAPNKERLSCEGQAYHSKNRAALERTFEERSSGFTIGGCSFSYAYTGRWYRSLLLTNGIVAFDSNERSNSNMSHADIKDRVLDILQDALAHCGC